MLPNRNLHIPDGRVSVSLFSFSDWHHRHESLAACLSQEEHDKVATLRYPKDRIRRCLSFALTRHVLAGRLGGAAPDVPLQRDEKGRPSVPGASFDFNISHGGDLLAIALGPPGIGVDVEPAEPLDDALSIARLFLRDEDIEYLQRLPPGYRDQHVRRLWTECEAFLKGTGSGIDEDLDRLHRAPISSDLTLMSRSEPTIGKALWHVHYLGTPERHHLSVATRVPAEEDAFLLSNIRIELSRCLSRPKSRARY